MGRYRNAELRKFREISHCSACVHYAGCQLWLAMLLMNDEFGTPRIGHYRLGYNQSLPDVLPLDG
jgi:hypothetical protein